MVAIPSNRRRSQLVIAKIGHDAGQSVTGNQSARYRDDGRSAVQSERARRRDRWVNWSRILSKFDRGRERGQSIQFSKFGHRIERRYLGAPPIYCIRGPMRKIWKSARYLYAVAIRNSLRGKWAAPICDGRTWTLYPAICRFHRPLFSPFQYVDRSLVRF